MSGGGKPPPAPDYVGAAREQGRQNIAALQTGAALNRVNQVGPTGSTTYTQDPRNPNRWTQTTSLSDDQQAIMDQSEANQIDLGRIANMRLGQVGQQGQFSFDGLPSQVSGVQGSNFQSNVGAPSGEQRARAEDAIYRSATRQLDPQFEQREDSTRTRLINSGLREGSEAWNKEMANLDRDRQAAYGDARDRAIMAGGAEASRMLSDDISRAGFANQTESQRFAQSLTNAQMQNEARATGMNERLTERQIPLQEFMSLYGGGGFQNPQNPAGIANVGSPEPVDYMGALNQQYGAQTDMYNYRQQRNQQNNQALLQGAAMAAMYFSDERMKEGIEPVGELPDGLGVYEFAYRDDPQHQRHTGVMAQEVEQIYPDAVVDTPIGYKAVDYAKVLSRALASRRRQ